MTSLDLRDYQQTAVSDIRVAFACHRRVLFVLPTGGGKTIIFAFIAKHAAAKGNKVIILAHRQEIVDQISTALSSMNIIHGRIQPGYEMTNDAVCVGMIQTTARRLDLIAEPTLLVLDEAHHGVAGTWKKITERLCNSKVLGVTATPERLDGVGLADAFDTIVLEPDVSELTASGYLAPFRYLAPSTAIDLSHVRTIGGDFNSGDLEQAVDQDGITGDVVQHYLQHLAGRTAIAFCVTVTHAKHVAERFCNNGISAESIDGTMSADERRSAVDRLRTGDVRVLTSCEIISEGFDAPAVGGAILLRPTQSFALYRQQVGRCLRPKEDGSNAIIVDHVGNVFRHDLPNAPHEWSLDSQKRTRTDREKARSSVRRCRACCEVFATARSSRDACAVPDHEDCLFRLHLPEREGVLREFAIDRRHWAGDIDIRNARILSNRSNRRRSCPTKRNPAGTRV
jgi:DNA repair protein RadD